MEREEGTGRINRRLARDLISRPATVKGWSETEEACKLQRHLSWVLSRTSGVSSPYARPHP